MTDGSEYAYLRNYAKGRCPDCRQPMTYIGEHRGDQPGTWFHDETTDRDDCPAGDGRL